MIDVQFISLVDELQVLAAVEVPDAEPRAIRLQSRGGFFDAQRVLINDFGVDTFTVVNDNFLLVNPPNQFSTITVAQMDFAVVSGSYTGGRSARLVFGPTKTVRKVEGLQKLVQQVVKTFLSNVGSNKFARNDGGDLLRSLGATLSPEGRAKVTASVSQAVSRTEEQVRAAQLRVRGLPTVERLLSLQLDGVVYLADQFKVEAKVRLVTFAGKAIDIPLTL